MLRGLVVFFVWVAVGWFMTPLDTLRATPGLRYLDDIVGLRAISLLLIAAAFLIAAALRSTQRARDMARYALVGAGICLGALLGALLIAPFFSDTSPSAGAWPFLGVVACRASYKSVTAHEVR
jgi:apolipoprotein N-acyltransferase